MSKLSATILLSSLSLFGATDAEIASFLQKQIGGNKNVSNLAIKVSNRNELEEPEGWESVIVNLTANVKRGTEERDIEQEMIYFVNGDFITKELSNMTTGQSLSSSVAPKFKDAYYSKENLIYGKVNAKHKIAIFSDPLCPFCRSYVPEAISYMKQYPDTFAVYYYHFPLPSLHPASVALTKAAIAAEQKGLKKKTLDLYKVEIDAHEKDEKKILAAFNKSCDTDISVADIHTPAVESQFSHDKDIAMKVMVKGTPTVFFDGEKDGSKLKYKEVKIK